jgi:hypothetical protein
MKSLIFAAALLAQSAFASGCYESTIQTPSPFMGNNDEAFRLADGSWWIVKFEYSYLYEYFPQVVICPGTRKLHIKGKALNIEALDQGGGRATKAQSQGTGDPLCDKYRSMRGQMTYADLVKTCTIAMPEDECKRCLSFKLK